MPGLFAQLHVGLGALRAHQFGLEMTGDNIANVSTPGFSRRRLTLSATRPANLPPVGQIGRGVTAGPITSLRSRFLEARHQIELSTASREQTRHELLQGVEATLSEDNGFGFQSELSALFNSFGELASQPESIAYREQVLARGRELVRTMKAGYAQLDEISNGINTDVSRLVVEVNEKLQRIASLNNEVARIEGRIPANAERDARAETLTELSELINVNSYENSDGTVTVTLQDGTALVVGDTVRGLTTAASGPSGAVQIQHQGTDVTSQITGGEIGGRLAVRDQHIPAYKLDLDTIAEELITQFNTLHSAGFALDTVSTGNNFFVPFTPTIPGDPTGAVNALAMDPTVDADPNLVAAAAVAGATGDGSQAQALADLATQPVLSGGTATFSDFYAGLTFRLGTDTIQAQSAADSAAAVASQIENQKLAVAAVSLDEEAVALIQFQRGYEASARFIRVVDELTQVVMGIGA